MMTRWVRGLYAAGSQGFWFGRHRVKARQRLVPPLIRPKLTYQNTGLMKAKETASKSITWEARGVNGIEPCFEQS